MEIDRGSRIFFVVPLCHFFHIAVHLFDSVTLCSGLMDLAVHQAAIDAGDAESGCTVHQVIEEVDGGAIICQLSVPIEKGETALSLKAKVC